MNILKAVLKHEVFPALGCTEPIAVAYAAGIAAQEIRDGIEEIKIKVDPGVYKNGFAVTIPNTGGEKGNLIAGVLGALIRKPELKMEILKSVSERIIDRAKELIHTGKAMISYDKSKTELYIEVFIKTESDSVRAVIEGSHMNLVRLEKNGQTLFEKESGEKDSADQEYKQILKNMKISELIDLAQNIDDEDYDHIKRGIDMNLEVSEAGQKLQKAGHYISDSVKKGYLLNDVFSSTKVLTTSAADARMSGLNLSVMSSGGSGNQGIVAILIPYNVGRYFNIEEAKIIQSIALSLLVNSYIKCFTGDLSPLCGCAIAAGTGAAVAIVYQQYRKDMEKITLAVNNLISDLGGILCDGAKEGCALKIATSTDSAIRSAYMAMNDYGITSMEGFAGKTAEETIYYLSKISKLGMAKVDDTILGIMIEKTL
ncbi:MAG: serine dehydratase subunit alpha family protein [Deltaproteobacteria bacterium]|nr:serine dehydratase subunit alpha family protein [Deltaproteobacteria bacterium]